MGAEMLPIAAARCVKEGDDNCQRVHLEFWPVAWMCVVVTWRLARVGIRRERTRWGG